MLAGLGGRAWVLEHAAIRAGWVGGWVWRPQTGPPLCTCKGGRQWGCRLVWSCAELLTGVPVVFVHTSRHCTACSGPTHPCSRRPLCPLPCIDSGAEAAMEWVFAHMGDADFNDPLPAPGAAPAAAAAGPAAPSPETLSMLTAMGFTERQVGGLLQLLQGVWRGVPCTLAAGLGFRGGSRRGFRTRGGAGRPRAPAGMLREAVQRGCPA